jgi:hypothetical protein
MGWPRSVIATERASQLEARLPAMPPSLIMQGGSADIGYWPIRSAPSASIDAARSRPVWPWSRLIVAHGGTPFDTRPIWPRWFPHARPYFFGLAAEPRLGRRTALTFPLLPPPQKNESPPSDSSPDTPTPGGISSFSRTCPV